MVTRLEAAQIRDTGLTERQLKFVDLVVRGHVESQAAKLAGFSDPRVDGWRLKNNPRVQAAIAKQLDANFTTELLPLAHQALREALQPGVEWRFRLKATEIVVKQASGDKDTEEMINASRDELAALKQELEARLAAGDGAKVIEATPEPTEPAPPGLFD